jgi:hypothetical protein
MLQSGTQTQQLTENRREGKQKEKKKEKRGNITMESNITPVKIFRLKGVIATP